VTGKRILVVDDSPTQAERLRMLLSRRGYLVDIAATGKEGLRAAEADQPDLIISDVTMPEMDGFEFCRAMKSGAITRAIPFILLTGRSSPADIMTGLECGADNFIPKPYEDDYLLERVRRVFEQLEHRKQDHLEMEVVLTVGGRKIRVTADRQQIIELLFATLEEISKHHDELARTNRELRLAQTQAEQANQAKSEFLYRVSHEIRTPLNAILGFTELLDTTYLAAEDKKFVDLIASAGQHLLQLINDLLDIGRIEEGELTLVLEPVPLADMFQETTELVHPLASERGITLTSGPTAQGLHVLADRQRLKQVLINLASNAIKYNRDAGSVTLDCRKGRRGRLRLEITDTGGGIAPENLKRLFVPFDRLGAEQLQGIQGTGLGLALSRRLVAAMGGAIGVESELGKGSTFWVELAQDDGTAGTAGAGAAPAPLSPVRC
jgi:two-component system, sensor histidine kinase and response regulator